MGAGFEWPDEEYTSLLAEHGERLTRLAYLLTGNRADAEDAVQDAVISVARNWRAMSKQSPVGYLRTAVTRRAIDIVRKRRHLPLDELLDLGRPDAGFLRLEDDLEFTRLLQELPEKQRAVLVLRYHQQLDDREIAHVLGCTQATVRSQASRGLAKLRERTDPDVRPIRGGELNGSGRTA
ncbi:RNA polymerase sigma factor [Gryllotalpicola protaetiae]|uniref:RNA polymerase sigma factor n=1 Tax=Gryllotalpicola protaetiae TaxID=2419771 RepID=UPI0013C4A536|nr:SigE family RNA polymerase sigma factor [Gryllotalpicola protaetiae]